MVLMRRQAHIIISQLNNLKINQPVKMAAAPDVKYVLSPFEGEINTGDQQGLKIYLR